ncbi:MAG: ATP-binding protein, partial [Rhodospirillales bacterium]
RKSGILLLNYLGEILIRDFREAAVNISEHTMLLNADGYWLSSPRPDDEWGFMYNDGHTFAKAHPNAWRRILAGDTGQFHDEKGMFSYTTIFPLLHALGKADADGKDGSPVTDREYYWKAVSYVPLRELTTTPQNFFRQYQFLYGAILALLAIASILLAHASVRHKQTVIQVEFERRFSNRLEEMVEKRTQELMDTQAEKDLVVKQLIQAEKMAALGTMASGIGHEINNPLYVIMGRAEAIRDEEDVDLCRGYGQDIVTHSKKIAEIVKNLAGYARPADEHDWEPVDVNDNLSEAISMTRRSLLSDRIEIKEDLNPVPVILAKAEEIQQVFFNVIRNGIQAMREKGTMEIASRQKDGRVSIQIRDTGVGISAEHLGRVFDPFFTTKGPDEGEGLGLFIVQQIVKKYSGTITFGNRKSMGTVCTIEFPVGENKERMI